MGEWFPILGVGYILSTSNARKHCNRSSLPITVLKLLSPLSIEVYLMLLFSPTLSDPTRSIVVIWVKNIQTESMAEIYSNSLVRAIGKVFLVKLS